ncbi:MAG TPA: CheR family methyltransferase [Ramlibacter sp.]|nr:CheR family methyltransferase [Ramlibacter sp.]
MPARLLAPLAERISAELGLHFAPDRMDELQHGLARAAPELGAADSADCAERLLATAWTAAQLRTLASHLTVGETYFFRDACLLRAFSGHILPQLLHSRRAQGLRQLRIWSAGCCTGEEPYSLAILLEQALPDLDDWDVTVTATDVNPRFLEKARAGRYNEWSFRGVPEQLKQRYFERMPDGQFQIDARIRALVHFAELNMAQQIYPSALNRTNGVDVIFCRNLLMYFSQAQARKAAQRLQWCLRDGGWLVVSPSEAGHMAFPGLEPVHFDAAVAFRKPQCGQGLEAALPRAQAAPALRPEAACEAQSITPHPMPAAASDASPSLAACRQAACALADQGRLEEALLWCDRWVAADRLDGRAHYVLGLVLGERGDAQGAQRALQRCIYLEPDFVLAHLALGQQARGLGQPSEAARHFEFAGQLLRTLRPHDPLPEAGGLTAGRLHATFGALAAGGRP